MYGEIVVLTAALRGMVQDVKRTTIGCIIFGNDNESTKAPRFAEHIRMPVVPVGGRSFLYRKNR